jgi:hypothetical protein
LRILFPFIGIVVAGCASHPVDPSGIGVALRPASVPCGESDRQISVLLDVSNASRGTLEIGVRGRAGPPFEVNWLYYEVLDGEEGGDVDFEHGPGGHGELPSSTLRIGPGDSTTVSAVLYGIGPEDYSKRFRIRIESMDSIVFTTEPFLPCIQSSSTQ